MSSAAPPPEPLVATMRLTAEDLVRRAVSSAGHGETVERPRWSWVAGIFGIGSTSAAALCRHFGFDPDEPRGRVDDEQSEQSEQTEQTYTLRPFDIREHMWSDS